jgi:hypothetical protein
MVPRPTSVGLVLNGIVLDWVFGLFVAAQQVSRIQSIRRSRCS